MTAPDPAPVTSAPAEQPTPVTPPAPVAPLARPSVPEVDGAALQAQLTEARALAARVPELETAHQTAEQRAQIAETQLARLTIARAAGLPDALAARLQGKDDAELTADAAALVELITANASTPTPTPATAAPLPPGRRPVEALTPASASGGTEPAADDPAAIAALVFGK